MVRPGKGRRIDNKKPTDPTDPFPKLPLELGFLILENLSSKDIANRLVTRIYRDLREILFRGILLREVPHLWELGAVPVEKPLWFSLYKKVKFGFGKIMGLRNRERVWRDVNEVMRRVEGWKKEGKIRDGKVVYSEDESDEGGKYEE